MKYFIDIHIYKMQWKNSKKNEMDTMRPTIPISRT